VNNISLLIFQIGILLYSVVLHEVAHGAVANSLGDPTARNLGRLTLNPLRHLDVFGSVILPLLLLISGSPMILGYAKPVPYNPINLSDRRFGAVKVALAGPAVNLILALLFGFVLRFLPSILTPFSIEIFQYVVVINLVLAIFNLFPLPPLDGHWLLMAFLPARFNALRIFLYKYSLFLLIIFLIFIFPLIMPLVGVLFRLITGV